VVRASVQLRQRPRPGQRDPEQLICRHDLIDEARLDSVGRGVEFRVGRRANQVRRGEPLSREDQCKARQRHADGRLVQPDLCGHIGCDPLIDRHQQHCTHGERMTVNRSYGRQWKREQSKAELAAPAHHRGDRPGVSGVHDSEIEAGREAARAPADHDCLGLFLRAIESRVEIGLRGGRYDVRLPVVPMQQRDVVAQLVANPLITHARLSSSCRRRSLAAGASRVARRSAAQSRS